jgi:hypothetical protein
LLSYNEDYYFHPYLISSKGFMMSRPHFIIILIGLIIAMASCVENRPTALIVPEENKPILSEVPTETQSLVVEPSSTPASSPEPAKDECLDCHANDQLLKTMVQPGNRLEGLSGWVSMELPAQEPWEKVFVDKERFATTVHGRIACTDCHGGVQSSDKEVAHQGVVSNPSAQPHIVCDRCHPNVVSVSQHSLHANLSGMWLALDKRSMPSNEAALKTAFDRHCSTCHATCGECHVSQPSILGGGLMDGHMFSATPSMTQNCIPCHSERVGAEYYGKNPGLPGDVHFVKGRMTCTDCHTGAEMHGQPAQCKNCHTSPESEQVPPPDHRFGAVQSPRCETCHVSVSTGQDGVIMHQMHGGNLACQVCHSVAYTQCEGCHVGVNPSTGTPSYDLKAKYLSLVIGRNPIPSYQRPYQIVTLRHVPIAADSFLFYGKNLLPDFAKHPTWTYATPQPIERSFFRVCPRGLPQRINCPSDHLLEQSSV